MSWLFCGLEHHSVLRTRRMFPMALWTGRRLHVENNLEFSTVSLFSWLNLLIKPRLEVRFPVPSPLSLLSLSVFPLRVAVHAAITTNISIFEREILQHFILALSLNSCSLLRNRSGEWLMTFLVEATIIWRFRENHLISCVLTGCAALNWFDLGYAFCGLGPWGPIQSQSPSQFSWPPVNRSLSGSVQRQI